MSDEIHQIDLASIDTSFPDVRESYRELNACLLRLQNLKLQRVSAVGPSVIMPKVVWKLVSFKQSILYRAVSLQSGVNAAINQNNALCSIILARSVLEVVAVVWAVCSSIEKGIASGDLGEIDRSIMKGLVAARWEDWKDEYRATNVLTLLSKIDKEFLGEPESGARNAYDMLSEFAHPNWAGTLGFFGELSQQERTYHFSIRPVDDSVHRQIISGALALRFIEMILSRMDEHLPEIWRISDSDTASGPKRET